MRSGRFNGEQIVSVLREASSTTVASTVRNHRVSEATEGSGSRERQTQEVAAGYDLENDLLAEVNRKDW